MSTQLGCTDESQTPLTAVQSPSAHPPCAACSELLTTCDTLSVRYDTRESLLDKGLILPVNRYEERLVNTSQRPSFPHPSSGVYTRLALTNDQGEELDSVMDGPHKWYIAQVNQVFCVSVILKRSPCVCASDSNRAIVMHPTLHINGEPIKQRYNLSYGTTGKTFMQLHGHPTHNKGEFRQLRFLSSLPTRATTLSLRKESTTATTTDAQHAEEKRAEQIGIIQVSVKHLLRLKRSAVNASSSSASSHQRQGTCHKRKFCTRQLPIRLLPSMPALSTKGGLATVGVGSISRAKTKILHLRRSVKAIPNTSAHEQAVCEASKQLLASTSAKLVFQEPTHACPDDHDMVIDLMDDNDDDNKRGSSSASSSVAKVTYRRKRQRVMVDLDQDDDTKASTANGDAQHPIAIDDTDQEDVTAHIEVIYASRVLCKFE
jgi:hypothetical protein